MERVTFAEFDRVYRSSLDEIWTHWDSEMQAEVARHCRGWAPGRFDFSEYLRLSSRRFYKAWQALIDSDARSLCDVGGFWGVWPLTAKRLGIETVTMTEALRYYGTSFDPLFDQIRGGGVTIMDYDPFAEDVASFDRFDLVTVMAVLEHYPHSLRTFMTNVKQLIADGGRMFIEVPNIAYWPNRIGLLTGKTPLPPISDVYESEVPFIGHHHEFTIAELHELVELAGLRAVSEETFNYSLAGTHPLKAMLRYPLMSLASAVAPAARECIAVVCEPEVAG